MSSIIIIMLKGNEITVLSSSHYLQTKKSFRDWDLSLDKGTNRVK